MAIQAQTLLRRYKINEQRWHLIFDFYRTKSRGLTKRQLHLAVIPTLYKEIWHAERDIPIEILPDCFLLGVIPVMPAVKLRNIYAIIISKQTKRPSSHWSFFWDHFFAPQAINYKLLWKSHKVPFIDGYTRNVHYSVVQKSLFTRHRLAKFVPGMRISIVN
ncbi:MAG: hypothetical protein GY853_15160 [PVC group bacterium]|nr:hypothetical protein [PVC group bacterium]